ncbi:MAG: DNA polymerase III subunit delta, partial [Pedobacter sp.]
QVISYLRDYDLKSKGLESTGNVTDGQLLKELIFKIIH